LSATNFYQQEIETSVINFLKVRQVFFTRPIFLYNVVCKFICPQQDRYVPFQGIICRVY